MKGIFKIGALVTIVGIFANVKDAFSHYFVKEN